LADSQTAGLFQAVSRAAQTEPFSLVLDKLAFAPPKSKPPRIIWLEGERSEKLSRLKENLERLLVEKINFLPEKRELRPHVSLGRIKSWQWRRIEPEERPDIDFKISIKVPVNSLKVMESRLKREGAEYRLLKEVKLKKI
jgi:2'-5' RNA ligase